MEAAAQDYQGFVVNNRVRINRYLNRALWLFVLTGPALALGVGAGIFPYLEYTTCLGISVLIAALSAAHSALVRFRPTSLVTSLFALTALDALLVYMAFNHVSIRLTWFLVPLLSILFCDRRTYLYTLGLNYVLMLAVTWATAPYYAAQGTAWSYFIDVTGGFTIETLVMAVSGYLIVKQSADYFTGLFEQREIIKGHEKSVREKMDVLDSMAEIYDNVNLISFVDNTETSLRDPQQLKHGIDMNAQTHTLMNQRIKDRVMPDQLDAFLEFTNITTVRERLRDKKIISADFIDVVTGWFRAQYITVDVAPSGLPDTVIYTTQNVDDEKKREEHLIRLSMTDEMTRLYNRRRYEEDLAELRDEQLADDLVLFSVDVNGLKNVNDTKGHAAGDELIKGAADCLVLSIGQGGRAYRTGGDEFMVIAHTSSPENMRETIKKRASAWHGTYTDEVTLSVGYASRSDHPDASVDDLEHMADADMYAEKERYYREAGIDRRRGYRIN